MENIANQLFKANIFVRPVCFIAFIFIILSNYKTGLTSAFVVAFSLLLFFDGVVSLKYSKPSLTVGLKKLWDSKISHDEKLKRENIIKGWHKFFSICGIAGSIIILYFWFFILNT